jgi:hypothetical protein
MTTNASSPSDDGFKDRIKEIFVDPTVSEKIVNLVTTNRPPGWSHRSHATYYKKCYAMELKPCIDKMMIDKNPIIYKYSTWCSPSTGYSPQTIYNRVNQSLRYILDNMDDSKHTYAEWYELVNVRREKGKGVVISYIPGFGNNDEETVLKPESIEPQNTKPIWYRRMDDWIEDNNNFEPFVKENLCLSDEEQIELKIRLSGLSNIQASITQDRVALIRLN